MRVGDIYIWHSYPRQGKTSKIIHGGPQGSAVANDDNAPEKVLVMEAAGGAAPGVGYPDIPEVSRLRFAGTVQFYMDIRNLRDKFSCQVYP
jgi:hypothetical protein